MELSSEQLVIFFEKIFNRLDENFHAFIALPLNASNRFYWVYLLTSLLFGALACLLPSAPQRDRIRPTKRLRQLFRKEVYLHPSALIDYAVFVLNQVFTPGVLITRLLSAAGIAAFVSQTLVTTFGPHHAVAMDTFLGLALFTLVVALVEDFGGYFNHMLLHRVPLLWEFHKVHHSAEVLTPITVARIHPVEDVFGSLVTMTIGGLFSGVAGYLLGGEPRPFTFFGASVIYVAFYASGNHLRHSDIWLAWPQTLSYIFISPAQHQIHHSVAPQHRDQNYGFIFAIWDWMFGTLYVPSQRENLIFGLGDNRETPHPTIVSVYLAPFKGAWHVLLGAHPRPPSTSASAAAKPVSNATALDATAVLIARHPADDTQRESTCGPTIGAQRNRGARARD